MQYLVRFNGKISWDGRANGLPETVHSYIVFEGDTQGLINAVYAQSKKIVDMRGMAAEKEQGKMTEIGKISTNGMFVPIQWIVFLDVTISGMTGELPMTDEEGKQRLKDGSMPTVN